MLYITDAAAALQTKVLNKLRSRRERVVRVAVNVSCIQLKKPTR